ncbi:hypothetical protein [Archaeoglobus profundus]|nr:hypothetical protein [Archaeoglobus profundus]
MYILLCGHSCSEIHLLSETPNTLMVYYRYMRYEEIDNGIVRFTRKLVKRRNGNSKLCLLYLPAFIEKYGNEVLVEVDTINKVMTVRFF